MYRNKRGQEGVSSTGFFVALVLILILGGLVALWYFGIFEKLGGASSIAPGKLAAIELRCVNDMKAGIITDYCKNFDEVDDNNFVNCQFSDLQPAIQNAITDGATEIECAPNEDFLYCEKLAQDVAKYNDQAKVNEQACADIYGRVSLTLTVPNSAAAGQAAAITAEAKIISKSGGEVSILSSAPIIFSTTSGTLSQTEVTTNEQGIAATSLTTDKTATITAQLKNNVNVKAEKTITIA